MATPRSRWASSTATHSRRSSTTLWRGDQRSAMGSLAYRVARRSGTTAFSFKAGPLRAENSGDGRRVRRPPLRADRRSLLGVLQRVLRRLPRLRRPRRRRPGVPAVRAAVPVGPAPQAAPGGRRRPEALGAEPLPAVLGEGLGQALVGHGQDL